VFAVGIALITNSASEVVFRPSVDAPQPTHNLGATAVPISVGVVAAPTLVRGGQAEATTSVHSAAGQRGRIPSPTAHGGRGGRLELVLPSGMHPLERMTSLARDETIIAVHETRVAALATQHD
jgi:hypothetical protein